MLHLAIMDELARRVASPAGWDEPPVLFTVNVVGRIVRLVPFTVPTDFWEHPQGTGAALELLAGALPSGARIRPGENGAIYGVGFLHEGWEVIGWDTDDVQEMRRIQKMADEHRLREHPAAREIRSIVVVDQTGITYQAKHVRGSGDTSTLIAQPGGDVEPSGAVIEALDLMTEKLTGAPRQKRPEPVIVTNAEGNLN